MGLAPTQAFLFAVGVAVALVPEGLLPTVTLSLARGASLMAGRNALVRRLEAVETLGDHLHLHRQDRTRTQNRMAVVEVWTPAGTALLEGTGYEPTARIQASPEVQTACAGLQEALSDMSAAGRPAGQNVGRRGDAMEAAAHAWSLRVGGNLQPDEPIQLRLAYTADRMLSSVSSPNASLSSARRSNPQPMLGRFSRGRQRSCRARPPGAGGGRRPLAPRRAWSNAETALTLLAVIGFEDPPDQTSLRHWLHANCGHQGRHDHR